MWQVEGPACAKASWQLAQGGGGGRGGRGRMLWWEGKVGDEVASGARKTCRAPPVGHRSQRCAGAGSRQLLRADCDLPGNCGPVLKPLLDWNRWPSGRSYTMEVSCRCSQGFLVSLLPLPPPGPPQSRFTSPALVVSFSLS